LSEDFTICSNRVAASFIFDYPGNVRSPRDFVFELTSHVEDRDWISVATVYGCPA
jgi:hypothetical protein